MSTSFCLAHATHAAAGWLHACPHTGDVWAPLSSDLVCGEKVALWDLSSFLREAWAPCMFMCLSAGVCVPAPPTTQLEWDHFRHV